MYGTKRKSISYSSRNTRKQDPNPEQVWVATSSKSWNNTRSGSSLPNWKQTIARHGNATTSFSATARDKYVVPITGFLQNNGSALQPTIKVRYNMRETDGGNYSGVNPSSIAVGAADISARSSFISQYRQARTAFQGGVFMGELMETVRMIARPARALREGVDRYHKDVKKRLRGGPSPSKRKSIVRDTWLEYSFGWAPFINDIRDASKLGCADPYQYTQKITGVGTFDYKDTDRVSLAAQNTGWPRYFTYVETYNSGSVRYMGAALAENNPPSFPEQLGFSWSNLAPTLWELIPYSFLVDYFSNVGKVIEGLSTGSISLAWGCRTQRQISRVDIQSEIDADSITQAIGNKSWQGFVSGAGNVSDYRDINRTKISSVQLGITDLRFRLPGTSTKWLNIAALSKLRR